MERTITNPIIKDEVTFIKTSSETDGAYTELLLKVMPGGQNLLHFHRTFTETFTVLQGNLGVRTGRFSKKTLSAGESVAVPPEQLHSFYNPGADPIEVKVIIRPAHEGFEQGLRIGYGMAHDGLCDQKGMPKKFSHMALGIVTSDINLPAPFSALMPLFRYIAQSEKRNGTWDSFINRYCK